VALAAAVLGQPADYPSGLKSTRNITSSTKHQHQSSPGCADAMTGWSASCPCLLACRFGEESQQPTCPQVRQVRRCTQRSPVLRHSSQPSTDSGGTISIRSMWEHCAMAVEERQIRGGDATVKVRNPVNSAILDAVTLGIYGFYWYYQVNKELAALGRARGSEELGTKPMNSFWAIMPGFIVLVPFLISGYNTGERVQAAQRGSGAGESINPIVAIVAMMALFPIGVFYVQQELNKVWEAETEAGAPPAGAPTPG
jgi:hypothetical protein